MESKKKSICSRLCWWLFSRIADEATVCSVREDLDDRLKQDSLSKGTLPARLNYVFHLGLTFFSLFLESICWSIIMFKNYLKIAVRNIFRHKAYSLINICGLALGMACCILILLFIQDELNYDRYPDQSQQIYRLALEADVGGGTRRIAPVGPPYAEIFGEAMPEIQKTVRINRGERVLVGYGNKKFFEEYFFYADPTIFEMFTFRILQGDPASALATPFSVVLTEAMARKYFGSDDPIGQTITLGNEHDFQVTAVMQDIPAGSHFSFDFVASLETLADLHGKRYLTHPGYLSFYTYLLLEKNANPGELTQKIAALVSQKFGAKLAATRRFFLQPLESIHLHSQLEGELEANSSVSFMYIYAAIALFILLIASFNFMNLSTARSANRAKEVGMRKVLGAFRMQLIKQFLGESILLSFLSLVFAGGIAVLLLPLFNSLTSKELALEHFLGSGLFLAFLGIVLLIGICAGLYPAFFLSAFQPVRTLKGKFGTAGRSSSLRRILVVAQFSISVVLITGTLIIQKQLRYMRGQNLGFNQEQVVIIPMYDENVIKTYDSLKQELLRNPAIISASASSSVPGKPGWSIAYRYEGAPDGQYESLITFFVDYDFVETLGLTLLAGRNFSQAFPSDPDNAFIINETAVEKFGWTDPLNKEIIWPSDLRRLDAIVKQGRVVGVVKDFNVTSLHENIGPVILQIRPQNLSYISLRIRPRDISSTLAFIQDKWTQFSPAFPYEYSFLDEDFDKLYRADAKIGRIIGMFSLLAIFIACLGLFGLGSFSAEQRTKEIGIRKVLGASAGGVVLLLSKEFAKWVLAANVIGLPAAYFVMQRWLQNFAYRTGFGVGVFVLSLGLTLAIALITVSYQSIRAAVANPIDSLRYE